MSSFVEKKLDKATQLLAEMNEALGADAPCYECFYKCREWCSEHCSKTEHKNYPDKECFKKYLELLVKDEIIELLESIKKDEDDYFGF